MTSIQQGDLLWQPTEDDIEFSNLKEYMDWLRQNRGLDFSTYPDLWTWSVENVADFWKSLWDYFEVKHSTPPRMILSGYSMPDIHWFEGAELNYAENIFDKMIDYQLTIIYKDETSDDLRQLYKSQIEEQVGRMMAVLRGLGVQKGDRVVAYLPNTPEAVIALLAVTGLGAIWSSCPPDFGTRSVLDRFTQIEPVLLIATDGYSYNGKLFDRRAVVAELQDKLPSVKNTILIPFENPSTDGLRDTVLWESALGDVTPPDELTFEQVPFEHPLWILYSSGTTGLPKPIVHGHGGILLEHFKALVFHNDIHPGDRFFWYSSTGWMMWNYVVGALLAGATAILYNGSPGYPDMNALWKLAEDSGMTYFGTSAAYISACIKAGITPNKDFDLVNIRGVGSTGSPLSTDGFAWVYENINKSLALESLSGGTDLCTAFVGGARIQPIYAGELQGASLGAKILAYNEDGQSVTDEVGELIIAEPMPSMPLYFWNDANNTRYKASYFEMFPGVWRHGDWISINERGGCVIYGRSDSTINRGGIRMGTSEIYRVVESFEEIQDSLVIDLELLGRESYMPLFVVMKDGAPLTDDIKSRIVGQLRSEVSPRHVPNEIIEIKEVPYTLSGKKMEIPVRKILLKQDLSKAINVGAMRNPEAIEFFKAFAERLE